MTGASCPDRVWPLWWSLVAFACYGAHAVELVRRYPWSNLLWSCNVAALMLAVALAVGWPRAVAAAAMLLGVGDVFWLLDIKAGGELLVTAPLTHGLSFALALRACRTTGVPPGSWLVATAVMVLATLAARLAGPASENVNLAFAIPSGYEKYFPGHAAYLALNASWIAGAFYAIERLARRGGAR